MEIRFLDNFDLTQLHQTFLSAFSDYLIPMNLDKAQFEQLLERRGARKDLSVAAFENNVPVGFTFNAFETFQSIPTVYDVVTGVVPAARHKGIARLLFEFSLPQLRLVGGTRYLLEVFRNNFPAVRLYEKIGFSVIRRLEVFIRSGDVPEITRLHPDAYQVHEIEPNWTLFESFWDWQPSWQNSIASMNRIHTQKHILGIFQDSELIGYGVVFRTGDIPQFAIHHNCRRRGAGTVLLNHLQSFVEPGRAPRVVNVDGSAEGTILFLRKMGFDLLGTQNEMEMLL